MSLATQSCKMGGVSLGYIACGVSAPLSKMSLLWLPRFFPRSFAAVVVDKKAQVRSFLTLLLCLFVTLLLCVLENNFTRDDFFVFFIVRRQRLVGWLAGKENAARTRIHTNEATRLLAKRHSHWLRIHNGKEYLLLSANCVEVWMNTRRHLLKNVHFVLSPISKFKNKDWCLK